jgi:uncharacterized protein (DUF1800 family)
VDFAVGTLRTLGARASAKAIGRALSAMGQELLAPPSVKGWDMGLSWLGSTTLLARYGFAMAVCGVEEAKGAKELDSQVPWTALEKDVVDRLFPEGLGDTTLGEVRAEAGGDPRALALACLQLPEYQFV